MRILIKLFALMIVATTVCGCATPYMVNRRRDFADIFTCASGSGGGVKARVGPLRTGLFFEMTGITGLKAGEFHAVWPGCYEGLIDVDLLLASHEQFDPEISTVRERGKVIDSRGVLCLSSPVFRTNWTPYVSAPARQRIPYFTQVEVAVGAWRTLRIGINPGEIVDFVLGWTTLDVYLDDIEQQRKGPSNQAFQAIGDPESPQPER